MDFKIDLYWSKLWGAPPYALSKLIEKNMLPPDAGLSMHRSGIMFGAKAVAGLSKLQIRDPITLINTKEYMRQCYMKPYIMGNFGGLKAAASKTDDILGFLEANPAQNLGVYYRDPSNKVGAGTITFKTCTQMNKLIKIAVKKELNNKSLAKYASMIGFTSSNQAEMLARLKAMTSDTLKYLEKAQTDVNEWMQQAMILNANRESYDDWREKFGIARVYPHLVSMQSTRGLVQQSMGYIVGGDMAASFAPFFQSGMLGIIVSLSIIVLPHVFNTWRSEDSTNLVTFIIMG